MELTALPFRAGLAEYRQQADRLLEAWRAGDAGAIEVFRHKLPRHLRADIPWLPRPLSDEDIRNAPLDRADAQLALARWYDFESWPRLEEHATAVADADSPVARFEAAVEAVIDGDLAALASLLGDDPGLLRARSARVTHFDPPVHRATLLHYVAANGVEGYRQRTPPNAVAVAKTLLTAGAEVDALAFKSFKHFTLSGSGTYLFNPRNTNGVPAVRPRPSEAVMSVSDQYLARVGVSIPVRKVRGFAFNFGGRLEGVPSSDVFGKSDGFRRPGYALSVEPGFSYSHKRETWTLNVPVPILRNRIRSVPEIQDNVRDAAAFADYLVLVGYSRRF